MPMRILEVTRSGFFKALQPDKTCWIRWGAPLTADEPHRPDGFGFSALAAILRRVRKEAFDLVVLPAIHPEHRFDEPWHKLAAKSVLQTVARSPVASALFDRLVGSRRHVIVDIADHRGLCETTRRLFPRSTLYFKRELDLDRVTEPDRIRSLSLFIPNEDRIPPPREKDIDVFFAGDLCNGIRRHAVETVRSLSGRGLRVFTPSSRRAMDGIAIVTTRQASPVRFPSSTGPIIVALCFCGMACIASITNLARALSPSCCWRCSRTRIG